MSHVATKWAFDQPELHRDMKPSEWAVLMVLADCHNPINGCFPSQDYLRAKTNLSERTVRDLLVKLKGRQLINWAEQRDDSGSRDNNRYALAFEPSFVAAVLSEVESQAAESAGSATGNLEHDQPAESDQTNRQNLPPLSNPVREPVKGTVEREGGRARAAEAPLPDPELLAEAMRLHHGAACDDLDKIHAAWRSLSASERKDAVERLPDWLAAAAKLGRGKLLGLPAYLGQKRWQALPKATLTKGDVVAGGDQVVGFATRPWWALVWRRLAAGGDEHRKLKFQFGEFAMRGLLVAPSIAPSTEEEAALARVESDSDDAKAWLRWLGDRGFRLRMEITVPFIWVPSAWRPDDPTKAMEFTSEGTR